MDRPKYYVYMAWHQISGVPIYVGKGCGNRKDSHNYLASKGRHYNPLIAEYFNQYGPLDFFLLRDGISEEDAISTEMALIEYFGRQDIRTGTLYNLTDGGEGVTKPKSPEWKAAISAALKGKKRTPEHCAAISAAKRGKKNPKQAIWASARFKGIPKTPEHNAKNSAAQKGRPKSAEHKAKLSAAKLARDAAKRAQQFLEVRQSQ